MPSWLSGWAVVSERTHIKADNWWKFEKPKGKHDIEYQMKYLADQLEDGKKISDIITDKAHKKPE